MSPDFQWISLHLNDDTSRLRLKYGKEHADDILQIEMRRKHAAKFRQLLARRPGFIFPAALAAEQATSDRLALFHATLIGRGDRVADLTAGLGVDAIALASVASEVTAVEQNPLLASVLKKNTADMPNFNVVEGDCRDFIKDSVTFDDVFIDPARRAPDGSRIFALAQCEPDVVEMMPRIMQIAPRAIVKASPMLDITRSVDELSPYACRAIALGTPTECKELDLVCLREPDTENGDTLIRAVTLGPDTESEFTFRRSEEENASAQFGVPSAGQYILDPYPAVMKAGPFRLLGQRFGVRKIGSNTHLWFSGTPVDGFPGTAYRIIEVLPYMSKHIKRYSSRFPRVAVTARNFDITSDALRAKLGVSEGDLRLFAVNAFDGRKLLVTCEKI